MCFLVLHERIICFRVILVWENCVISGAISSVRYRDRQTFWKRCAALMINASLAVHSLMPMFYDDDFEWKGFYWAIPVMFSVGSHWQLDYIPLVILWYMEMFTCTLGIDSFFHVTWISDNYLHLFFVMLEMLPYPHVTPVKDSSFAVG